RKWEKRFYRWRFSQKRPQMLSSIGRKHLRNVQLELELDSQSKRRRILENGPGQIKRIRNVRLAGAADGDLECFILTDGALCVEGVEPVNLELQLLALRELDRI